LVQTLSESKAKRITVLLDHCRGTRTSREGHSSASLLAPVVARNGANVALYHTPALRGWRKALLPQRFNEMVGLQHAKLFVFDDSVLVSGANLSQDYFTNRQDR